MKQLVIIALVAVGGFLAWNYIPGLRTAAANAKDKLTSWSEEDRKNDPVGYINYAKGKLNDNISKYEGMLKELANLETENKTKRDEFARTEKGAVDLLNEAKERFVAAEAAGEWPITVFEGSYTKDQFLQQVETWMADRTNATRQLQAYEANLTTLEESRGALRGRVQDLQQAIADLDTKEATLKVAALTEADTQLLAQVDDLLEQSSKALTGDSPIRSVKDILAQQDAAAAEAEKEAAKAASKDAVLDFLNS